MCIRDRLEAFQTRAELRDERKNLALETDSDEESGSKNKKTRATKEDVVEEDVVEEDVVEEDVVEEDDEQNEKEAN